MNLSLGLGLARRAGVRNAFVTRDRAGYFPSGRGDVHAVRCVGE
jgi:hypothetical protein